MSRIRCRIGDLAEIACGLTGERFWRLLHPVIAWGWKP